MFVAETEMEREIESRWKTFSIITPIYSELKSRLFLGLLNSFNNFGKTIGLDLDYLNPENPKNYFKNVLTTKDFEIMGYKPWRVSSRSFILKKFYEETSKKNFKIVLINFPPGISEDFLIASKVFNSKNIALICNVKKNIVSRFLKIISSENIKIDIIFGDDVGKEASKVLNSMFFNVNLLSEKIPKLDKIVEAIL